MNYSEVRKLVKLVESSDIEELELEREGTRIRVTKPKPAAPQAVPQVVQAAAPAAAAGATVAHPPAQQVQAGPPAETEKPKTHYHEVKSPMVGTFYSAPAPDADPYVQVGDAVKQGQTVCIVEAMKLMNEIESDVSGRIVEIKVENADPVEFGQVIFLIDPRG